MIDPTQPSGKLNPLPGQQIQVSIPIAPAREAQGSSRRSPMGLSADLLAILVCPACKGDLVYDPPAITLTCSACRLRYKVVADIPVMLVDEAEKL